MTVKTSTTTMVVLKRSPFTITAYVTDSGLAPASIQQFRDDFAIGAFARYDPMVEVEIVIRPEFLGLSPESVRRRVDAELSAPNVNDLFNPFLILDSQTTETRSVWWVGDWANEEEYEEEVVVRNLSGEPVLWKLRAMTTEVASIYANLETGNISLSEMLDEQLPYDSDAPQTPYSLGIDYSKAKPPPMYLTALPGEWEHSTDEGHLTMFSPRPDRVVRLKEDIAKKEGLINNWTVGWEPHVDENVPKGSLSFAQDWDLEADKV